MRKTAGFTILELMATVAIAAVITAFAIPAFQSFMARNRVSALSSEIADSLAFARNTAISKRRTVVWLPASSGWTLRMDGSGGTLLEAHLITAPTTVAFATTPAPNVTEITFLPTGQVQRSVPTPSAALTGWSATVCDAGARVTGSVVTISAAGLIKKGVGAICP